MSYVGIMTFLSHDVRCHLNWQAKLQYSVSQAFVSVRMGELFDLVAEYPYSLPAMRELSVALERTEQMWYSTIPPHLNFLRLLWRSEHGADKGEETDVCGRQ